VLWIRTGFNADPNPFYLNADLDPDPDPDPGSQTNANPDPGRTLKSQQVELFTVKNIFKVCDRSKTYGTCEGAKAFLKGRKPGLFVNFGQFP
jgi:hypothetical protein